MIPRDEVRVSHIFLPLPLSEGSVWRRDIRERERVRSRRSTGNDAGETRPLKWKFVRTFSLPNMRGRNQESSLAFDLWWWQTLRPEPLGERATRGQDKTIRSLFNTAYSARTHRWNYGWRPFHIHGFTITEVRAQANTLQTVCSIKDQSQSRTGYKGRNGTGNGTKWEMGLGILWDR